MEEVSRNNTVQMVFGENNIIMGAVLDFLPDRIMVTVAHDYIEAAKVLNELDNLTVSIYTPMGIKTMKSSVISPLNMKNCIIIENNPVIDVAQRREFVRINNNFDFWIAKPGSERVKCSCVNISAGGVAFKSYDKVNLSEGDEIVIAFPLMLFEKDIITNSVILKGDGYNFVAKYKDISSKDEDKIVKYVFKVMTRSIY